jgi:hypothetical protein
MEVEAVESVRHERLRGRSRGTIGGEGIWLLRADGAHTDVTCVWRVNLVARWLRWLAPLVAPLVRGYHHALMRAGGAGLARYLAAGRPRT